MLGRGPQRPSCCPLVPRVDGKDVSYESRLEHKRDLCDFQRVSPDAKDPRLCRPPRNGIVGHLRGCQDPPEKVGTPPPKSAPLTSPSIPAPWGLTLSFFAPGARRGAAGRAAVGREPLRIGDGAALRGQVAITGERGSLGHFWGFSSSLTPFCVPTACGSLTRTLDSGIGTFPPPDYGGVPAKSTPKPRGRPEPLPGAVPGRPAALTKVPRKARTLEREVPSVEELLVPGKHRGTGAPCRTAGPPGTHSHRGCPQGACPSGSPGDGVAV